MLMAASPATADEAKDYAYLFLQGKLTDDTGRHPLIGATVKLYAGSRVFEAVSDRQGVFVFDELPVTTYEMEITTATGEVVRSIREIGPEGLDRKRFEIRTGKGAGKSLKLETDENRFDVIVEEPAPRWSRFWKQFLIFLGGAALLAL